MTQYRILQFYEKTREGDRYFVSGDSSPRTCTHRQLDIGIKGFWPDGTKAEQVIREVRLVPVRCTEQLWRWLDEGEYSAGAHVIDRSYDDIGQWCGGSHYLEADAPPLRLAVRLDKTPLWSAIGETKECARCGYGAPIEEVECDKCGNTYLQRQVCCRSCGSEVDACSTTTICTSCKMEGLLPKPDDIVQRISGENVQKYYVQSIVGDYAMTKGGTQIQLQLFCGRSPVYVVVRKPRRPQVGEHRRKLATSIPGLRSRLMELHRMWCGILTPIAAQELKAIAEALPEGPPKEGTDAQQENQKEAVEAHGREGDHGRSSRGVGASAPTETRVSVDPYLEHRRKLAEPRLGLRSRLKELLAYEGWDRVPKSLYRVTQLRDLAHEILDAMPEGPPFDDLDPPEPLMLHSDLDWHPKSTIKDPYVEKQRTSYVENDWDYGDWQK